MAKMLVDVLSEASNQAVVVMPGRAFPGIVIQGDSLASLSSLASVVRERAGACADDDLVEYAVGLSDILGGLLRHYQATLLAAGWRLPYELPE